MFARSTTLHARPGSIDAGITELRDEILPALRGIEGFVGASLIVDRESGLCIVTASWTSAETRQASRETVMPLRERAAATFGADSVDVDEWEIAVMHRDHRAGEGACVRATWTQVEPAEAESAVDYWKLAVLPAIENLEGFCSASLMVDRRSGRGVSSVTFDSRAALERTREQAAAMRGDAARKANVDILDVREFDLAVAHLDVPEMA